MNTAMIESTLSPLLDERETEMMGTRLRAACFDALACAETTYAAAGISFEQDGQWTKAILSGHIVASMIGRFSKGQMLQAVRGNIVKSARDAGSEFLSVFRRDVSLPTGHVIGFDLDAGLHQVAHRGSRRLTAYVFRAPGSLATPYFGEINVDLYICQAKITFKEGEPWGHGQSVLGQDEMNVSADTYAELSLKVVKAFNLGIESIIAKAQATAGMY